MTKLPEKFKIEIEVRKIYNGYLLNLRLSYNTPTTENSIPIINEHYVTSLDKFDISYYIKKYLIEI